MRTRLANEYTYDVASPFLAAERGELDGIIEPAKTRVVDREGAARAARQARQRCRRRSTGTSRCDPATRHRMPARPRPLSIDVLRGDPTPEELAALIAVVTEAYATEAAHATSPTSRTRSAWSASQRGLRTPLRRDAAGPAPPGSGTCERPQRAALRVPRNTYRQPRIAPAILMCWNASCVRPAVRLHCRRAQARPRGRFSGNCSPGEGRRLRRPSPSPTPLPAPAFLPRRDGEQILFGPGTAASVPVEAGVGDLAPEVHGVLVRESLGGPGPAHDRDRDALMRRRADVQPLGARRAQRLGELGCG